MALKSPIMPSPTGHTMNHFSSWTDHPNSPAAFSPLPTNSKRLSGSSNGPEPPPSPYPQHVDPSPVDSNGTEVTDIDDEEDHSGNKNLSIKSPSLNSASPISPESMLGKLDTELALRTRADSDGALQSVIYAPQDFKSFSSKSTSPQDSQKSRSTVVSPSESSVANTVVSPNSPPSASQGSLATPSKQSDLTSPLETDVAPARSVPTPRAQTMQEVEEERRRRNRHSSSLEDIPEGLDQDRPEAKGTGQPPEVSTANSERKSSFELVQSGEEKLTRVSSADEARAQQVNALKESLTQCWTLCNSFAGLSSNHRNRVFSYRGKSEVQEQAWRSCWRLCQKLYETREEDHQSHVLETLELCRDFCQALFEARQKGDEAADSVLRVSFELNNHLYNTHDRNLPIPFQERTLDFYLTLCHRLMKQRTSLPEETDSLLRACWSLAEMLFSLRQNNREGKPADEELLGSAVQACWELCDIFREAWAQVRPDRTTPRPTQTTFSERAFRSVSAFSGRTSPALSRTSSQRSRPEAYHHISTPPETPTTIFDDTNDVDDHIDNPNAPNILVLGTENSGSQSRWPSSASSYSETSQHTSSTATINTNANNLARVRTLLVKAAMNSGFTPRSPPGSISSIHSGTGHSKQQTQMQNNQALLSFVKAMPSDSFGTSAWQTNLLEKYRRMVLGWSEMMKNNGHGSSGASLMQAERVQVTAAEIARAVQWMMSHEQYTWMRDLFRWVFGYSPNDATNLPNVFVQA